MRRRSIGGAAILMMLAAAWFAWLGPRELGGPAAYVVAEGNSMEPGIGAGDLVVTQQSGSYEPGDVVAYENADLGRRVMHRIVEERDGRFVLQGDNNDWLDSYRPTANEVIGRQRFRIPSAGTLVMTMRNLLAPLALGVALLAAAVLHTRSRRRAHDDAADAPERGGAVPDGVSRNWWAELPRPATAWGLTGVLALATVVVFLLPTTQTTGTEHAYGQQGRFDYHAAVPAGPVYSDGAIDAGDPVYLRVADSVDVAFDYRFEGDEVAAVTGTARLDLVVSERNGWSRRFVLQPETAFDGAEVSLEGRADLASLAVQLEAVAETSGWDPGLYRVTLAPVVEVAATVAGRPVTDRFAPTLEFDFDDVSLRPLAAADDPGGDVFAPAAEGTVSVPTETANTVPVLGTSVATARGLATAAVVAGLAFSLTAAAADRRRRRLPPSAQIEIRGRDRLIEGRLPAEAEHGVELTEFEDLLAFAEVAEAPIIHEHLPGHGDVYGTRSGGVWYWHEVVERPDARRAAEQWVEVTASIPFHQSVAERRDDSGPRADPSADHAERDRGNDTVPLGPRVRIGHA